MAWCALNDNFKHEFVKELVWGHALISRYLDLSTKSAIIYITTRSYLKFGATWTLGHYHGCFADGIHDPTLSAASYENPLCS